MKTLLAAATVIAVLGTFAPAAAIPDPDRLGYPPEHVELAFPFDEGSAPVQHIAGQDWLPARRMN